MLALTAVSCGHHPSVSQEEIACVRDFIRTSWDASVQYNPTDSQTLIGLPRPYTVPSVSQTFQELYYWLKCPCIGKSYGSSQHPATTKLTQGGKIIEKLTEKN